MATGHQQASKRKQSIQALGNLNALAEHLAPRLDALPPRIPNSARLTTKAIEARWALLCGSTQDRAALCDPQSMLNAPVYERSIENFIGEMRIPIGIAGPLRVNGLSRRADYHVPLATTEAALVVSYSRGMHAISEAGGCAAWVTSQGVMRVPGFAFRTTAEAGLFIAWVLGQMEAFRAAVATTTSHGELVDLKVTVEGNHVYLGFEFTTGDAAGQNMVTLAAQAICDWIEANTPVKPRYWFVEANMSGDKKASAQSYVTVRGRKATAEVVLPQALVGSRLGADTERMIDYWRMSALGGVMSGTLGVQGHFANGLAALYLACGQDVACVAESAVGIIRMEQTEAGDLYAAVTLPNLIVGTVGGATGLPTPRACLNILGLSGPGNASALAELCAGTILAGEISIIAALSAGHFTRAHKKRARPKSEKSDEGTGDSSGDAA